MSLCTWPDGSLKERQITRPIKGGYTETPPKNKI